MSTFDVIKVAALVAIVSGIGGAAFMRSHLNAAHKIEVAKLDRACLKSVFETAAKNHKRKVKNPVYVVGK